MYWSYGISNLVIFGEEVVTAIIYDHWGEVWYQDLKKLDLKIDVRKNLNGDLPNLENIPLQNDIIFVWTGTSNGMTINNVNFIDKKHQGLVISDVTSAVFIDDLPWTKIDVSVFSWQKALGSESQNGIIVMSPKALKKLKKKKFQKSYQFMIMILWLIHLLFCLFLILIFALTFFCKKRWIKKE